VEGLFASGRIIDLILLLVALEITALPWLLNRLGSATRLADLLPNILAGAALLLAVRLSLAGSPWQWVGAALFAALLAHAWDLRRRLGA
jgi:hypothetical protein